MKKKILEEIGHIIFYGVAIGFGFIVHYFFDNNTDKNLKLAFLAIIITLIILYFFFSLLILKPKEDKEHQKWMTQFNENNYRKISTLYKRNNSITDNAYIISTSAVQRAENKIIIVSDYSPNGQSLNVPIERQNYFKKIEEVLENTNIEFSYTRFMQREKLIVDSFVNSNSIIDVNELILGDEQAFAHCIRVFEIAKKNPLLKFDLYLTEFLPSIPSILIIDNYKMLCTIPKRSEHSGVDAAGIFEFIDNTKDGQALINCFIEITESLKIPSSSKRIKSIDNNLLQINSSLSKYF